MYQAPSVDFQWISGAPMRSNREVSITNTINEQNLHTLQQRDAVESDQITLGVASFSSCMVYEDDGRSAN